MERARSASSLAIGLMPSLPRSPLTSEQSTRRSRQVTEGWRGYGMRGDTNWLARRTTTAGGGAGGGVAAGLSAQLFATTDWESLARDEGRCTTPGVLDGVRLLEKLTLEEEEVISAGQTCRVCKHTHALHCLHYWISGDVSERLLVFASDTGRWHPQAEQKAKLYDSGTLSDQTTQEVSFQWKNPDFLSRNPDFPSRNPDFLLKNVDFIIYKKHRAEMYSGVERSLSVGYLRACRRKPLRRSPQAWTWTGSLWH